MSNEEVQSSDEQMMSIEVKRHELRFLRHLTTNTNKNAHSSITKRLSELKCSFDEQLCVIKVVDKDAEFVQTIISNIVAMQLPVIEGFDVSTEEFSDVLKQQNINCMIDSESATVYAENNEEIEKFNNYIDSLKSAKEPVAVVEESEKVEASKDDSLNEEKNTVNDDGAKNSSSDEGSADFEKIESSEFEGINVNKDEVSQQEAVEVKSVEPVVEIVADDTAAATAEVKEEFEKIEDIGSEATKLENFDDITKQIAEVVQNIQQEVSVKPRDEDEIGGRDEEQAFEDFAKEADEHQVVQAVPLAEAGDDFEKIEESDEKSAEVKEVEKVEENVVEDKVESVEQPVIDDVVASVVKQFQTPLMAFTEEFEKVEQENQVESEEDESSTAHLIVQELFIKEKTPVTNAPAEPQPIVEEPPSEVDEDSQQQTEDIDDFEKIEKVEIEAQFNNLISEIQQEAATENVKVEEVPVAKTFREKVCEEKSSNSEFDAIGKLVLVVLMASIGVGQIIKFFWN